MNNTLNFTINTNAKGINKLVNDVDNFGKRFKKLATELSNVNAVASKSKQLQQLGINLSKQGSKISVARNELQKLGLEIKNSLNPSKKLINEYKKKQAALTNLITSQKKYKSQFSGLKKDLRETGVNTKNLTATNKKYAKSIEEIGSKLKNYQQKRQAIEHSKNQRLQNAANLTFVGGGMLATGNWLKNKFTTPFTNMKMVERSKGELQSIMSVEGAQKIVDAGREASSEISGMSSSIFTSAAYVIKSSMSKLSDKAVANMTKSAAITAKATKSDLATMTELYAKGSGVFKKHLFKDLDDSQFGNNFGSAIAKTVQTFNTDGMKMASAIRVAGESASMAGISMGEQLAILGQAQQVLTAEQAGTAYSALLRNPAAAQEKLAKSGVDVELLNDKGNVKSMPEMLAEFERVFGKTLESTEQGILSQAFGDEAMKLIKNAWGTGSEIAKNAETINKVAKQGIGFSKKMMDDRQKNFYDKWEIQKQKWTVITEKIGSALLPVLEKLLPVADKLANLLSEFVSDNKNFTAILASGAFVLAGFLTVGGGAVLALASLSGAAASAAANLKLMSLNRGLSSVGNKGKNKGKVGKFAKGGGLLAAGMSAISLYDSWTNDDKSTAKKLDDTTEVAGGLGGAWGGAIAGAALGSAVPVIGTAIGSAIGGLVGYWGGSAIGDKIGDLWLPSENEQTNKTIATNNNIKQPAKVKNVYNTIVNNPSSDVDVIKALETAKPANTTLQDEEI